MKIYPGAVQPYADEVGSVGADHGSEGLDTATLLVANGVDGIVATRHGSYLDRNLVAAVGCKNIDLAAADPQVALHYTETAIAQVPAGDPFPQFPQRPSRV